MIDNADQNLQSQKMQEQTNQQINNLQLLFKNHTHNNINSFRVLPTDLKNYNYFYALNTVQLTPNLINNLHSQPQILVPSQSVLTGINTSIIVEGITAKLNYGGIAYAGANNLEFRYTDGSGIKVTADMSSLFLNSNATIYDHVAGVSTEFSPSPNVPIVVCVPTANPTTGNSNITFVIKYRIVTL